MRFATSIRTIAIYDISSQNKNIFGGLIYLFIKPMLMVLALFAFISFVRRGYTIEYAIQQFLLPITFYYLILSFITSTHFVDANQDFKFLPNINDLSILFGKILSILIIQFWVTIWIVFILLIANLDIELLNVLALFASSFLLGASYLLGMSLILTKKPALKELHSLITRFLLFISCVIFPLSIFPLEVQKIFLYNPIVHISELGRLDFTQNIITHGPEHLSLKFVMTCSSMLFLIFLTKISYNLQRNQSII